MRKLFYGFPVPGELGNLLIDQIKSEAPSVAHHAKWVKEANFHITLRFVGFVKPERVANFIQILNEKLTGIRKFTLDINKICRFPNENSRVIVACLDVTAGLNEIFNRINKQVLDMGICPDNRSFKPHITLCRSKPTYLSEFTPISIEKMQLDIDRLILYESVAENGAHNYKILENVRLL